MPDKPLPSTPATLQQAAADAQTKVNILKQAKRESLSFQTEGAVDVGRVRVKVNGEWEITELKINPIVLQEDTVEEVQDLVTEALNLALFKMREKIRQHLRDSMGGLEVPGLF